MRKSGFTEEQIIWILKEHQAGLSAAGVCSKQAPSMPFGRRSETSATSAVRKNAGIISKPLAMRRIKRSKL